MAKSLSCRDVGADCDFTICAKTEGELLEKAKLHGKEAHNMSEISKDVQDKIRSSIRDVERC